MAAAISVAGPCTLIPRKVPGGAFGALVRAVCYQQLAGAAASTIHGRFVAVYQGQPTPAAVMATDDEVLRGVGLSRAKVASIKDLAARALDGRTKLSGWSALTDQQITDHLCTVRGIGPWTAQMFLMFQLGRPDVWPVGDLGVRVGFSRIQGLVATVTPAELTTAGERYRPFRTAAAWYCWRAVDVPPPPGSPPSPWT